MKSSDITKLKVLLKKLAKDEIAKECRDYAFSCANCMTAQLVKEFTSFVDDYIMSDEEISKWVKESKFKK